MWVGRTFAVSSFVEVCESAAKCASFTGKNIRVMTKSAPKFNLSPPVVLSLFSTTTSTSRVHGLYSRQPAAALAFTMVCRSFLSGGSYKHQPSSRPGAWSFLLEPVNRRPPIRYLQRQKESDGDRNSIPGAKLFRDTAPVEH